MEDHNGYWDRKVDHAVYSFQADNGLRRDGFANPGGEMENALEENILSTLTQSTSNQAPSFGDGAKAGTQTAYMAPVISRGIGLPGGLLVRQRLLVDS